MTVKHDSGWTIECDDSGCIEVLADPDLNKLMSAAATARWAVQSDTDQPQHYCKACAERMYKKDVCVLPLADHLRFDGTTAGGDDLSGVLSDVFVSNQPDHDEEEFDPGRDDDILDAEFEPTDEPAIVRPPALPPASKPSPASKRAEKVVERVSEAREEQRQADGKLANAFERARAAFGGLED